MSEDVANLARVRERIDAAALAHARPAVDVQLLLAVKTIDAARVRALLEAGGTTLIGQNRAQELTATEPELVGVAHSTHFIGHLQSNKVNAVLRWVDCVQSVDSARLAERLNRAAATRERDLDVFVQVNTSGEATKAGTHPDEAADLAAAIGGLEHLRLRGFMTIGANSPDVGRVRASYDALVQVRDTVVSSGQAGTGDAHELSMGMSRDLEVAIAAGATMVRVGTGVFGARD